jgi:hypothetical protein
MKILDTGHFDIVALNETHSPALHRTLHECAKRNRYTKLELPARRFASAGRYCGDTVVFIRKNYVLQNVAKVYHDWGEEVSFVLDTKYVFHCIYRNPKSKFNEILPLFVDTLNTSQYHLFFGDFNSELLAPSTRLRVKRKPVDLA